MMQLSSIGVAQINCVFSICPISIYCVFSADKSVSVFDVEYKFLANLYPHATQYIIAVI